MDSILSDSIKINRVVFSEETIKARVAEIGAAITKDFAGESPVIIGVLKGSLFFLTDLSRQIDLPISIDVIGFGNIPDTTSKTGVVKITKDIDIDITDRPVIIVEDVIRTGLTTAYLISSIESKMPKSITLCSLLLNPDRLLMTIPVKYYGFEISDNWLIGYGLDVDGIGRNIPYIAELHQTR